MSIVWSALALGILQLFAGIVIGWSLARRRRTSCAEEAAQLQGLAANVRALIHDVHGQVDDHQSQMCLLSEQFRAGGNDQGSLAASIFRSVSGVILANERLQGQLISAEQRLESQEAKIEDYAKEARTDALTRLPNRRAFDDSLTQQVAIYDRAGIPFSLVMLDVDRFKDLNDRWGHPFGDEVLRRIAKSVRQTARQTDFVARIGGEEFAIVMPGVTGQMIAVAAERIRRAVSGLEIHCEGVRVPATISLGAAMITAGETSRSLVERADAALYASKGAGRNCIHWHDGKECRLLNGSADYHGVQPTLVTATGEKTWEDQTSWQKICDDLRRRLSDLVGGEC